MKIDTVATDEFNTDVEFVFVEGLDPRVIIKDQRRKFNERIARLRKLRDEANALVFDVSKALATRATLPEGVEYRGSMSDSGWLTITIHNLDSFHDVTEVMAVCHEFQPNIFGEGPVSIEDSPAERKRTITYYGKGCFYIKLVCTLGPEALGCKVVTRDKTEWVTPDETPKVQRTMEVTEFLCPGEPGYDDA